MSIENGSRYAEITRSLSEQPGLTVVETSSPRVNERKGLSYTDTRILVAPESGNLTPEEIQQLGAGLLTGVQPVNRGEDTLGFGRLTSFDRLGPHSFRTIAVELYGNADEALSRVK